MNNLKILEEIKKNYNPKNAFGNQKLLGLLKQIKTPDDQGFFEVTGESFMRIESVEWECVACGRVHIIDEHDHDNDIDYINNGDELEKNVPVVALNIKFVYSLITN